MLARLLDVASPYAIGLLNPRYPGPRTIKEFVAVLENIWGIISICCDYVIIHPNLCVVSMKETI
eukprot:5699811-Pleurochrysis_carterae.AAC.1